MRDRVGARRPAGRIRGLLCGYETQSDLVATPRVPMAEEEDRQGVLDAYHRLKLWSWTSRRVVVSELGDQSSLRAINGVPCPWTRTCSRSTAFGCAWLTCRQHIVLSSFNDASPKRVGPTVTGPAAQ